AEYLYWWHFANAPLMPALVMDLLVETLGAGDREIVRSRRDRVGKAYAMIEERLGKSPYLAGDELTAADIIMFFPLKTLRHITCKDRYGHPNLLKYPQRVGSRPAYQRAMGRADPDFKPVLS